MAQQKGAHTIIIMQHNGDLQTRTWMDFESVPAAMDGLTRMFEYHLTESSKDANPHIEYNTDQLAAFFDKMTDLSCLTLNRDGTNTYIPHDKEWIKTQVFRNLRREAGN